MTEQRQEIQQEEIKEETQQPQQVDFGASSFLFSDKEKSEIKEKLSKIPGAPVAEKNEEQPPAPEVIDSEAEKLKAAAAVSTKEAKTEADKPKEEKPEKEDGEKDLITVGTKFGNKTYGEEKKEKVEYDENEKFYATLIKESGLKGTPEEVIGVIKKNIDLASKFDEYEKENNEYKVFFEGMPDDIRAINTAYASNDNYRELLKKYSATTLDYNKDLASYSDKQIVEAYNDKLPIKIDLDEWDDLEESTKLNASALAKEYFKAEKLEIKNYTKEQEKKNDNYLQKRNNSIEKAINAYAKEDDSFSTDQQKEIKGIMAKDLTGLFFNDDGTFKEDAAKRLKYALYGEEALKEYDTKLSLAVKKATKKANSTAREEIITSTDDKIEALSGNNQVKDLGNAMGDLGFIDKANKRVF